LDEVSRKTREGMIRYMRFSKTDFREHNVIMQFAGRNSIELWGIKWRGQKIPEIEKERMKETRKNESGRSEQEDQQRKKKSDECGRWVYMFF
jgi:hypothetical protein